MTRLKRVPPLHMPRLDWRLWLLAQGRGDSQRPGPPPSSWYAALLERLVEGSPDVLALLEPPSLGQVHDPNPNPNSNVNPNPKAGRAHLTALGRLAHV